MQNSENMFIDYHLVYKIKQENVHLFWAGLMSQVMTSHTNAAHY